MYILIFSILFAIFYIIYSGWIYIKSNILQIERIKTNDISIENIEMRQYFHF
jgi:hypothetical protein